MEKLFSPEEVAEYLNVKPEAVRIWLRTAKIRGSKLGNIWRIPESAITEFLAAQENRPSEKVSTPQKEDNGYLASEPMEEPFTKEPEEETIQSEDVVNQTASRLTDTSEPFPDFTENIDKANKDNAFPSDDQEEEKRESDELAVANQGSCPEKEIGEEDINPDAPQTEDMNREEDEKKEKKPPAEDKDKLHAVFDQFDPFN